MTKAEIGFNRQRRDKKRVGYLQKACDDGRRQLNEVGYAYAVEMAQRLEEWGNPEELKNLRIERIEDFYELKLKGNVLGKQNLRIFFAYFDSENLIVILGTYIKNEEGAMPEHIKIKIRNLQRRAAQMIMNEKPTHKR